MLVNHPHHSRDARVSTYVCFPRITSPDRWLPSDTSSRLCVITPCISHTAACVLSCFVLFERQLMDLFNYTDLRMHNSCCGSARNFLDDLGKCKGCACEESDSPSRIAESNFCCNLHCKLQCKAVANSQRDLLQKFSDFMIATHVLLNRCCLIIPDTVNSSRVARTAIFRAVACDSG